MGERGRKNAFGSVLYAFVPTILAKIVVALLVEFITKSQKMKLKKRMKSLFLIVIYFINIEFR